MIAEQSGLLHRIIGLKKTHTPIQIHTEEKRKNIPRK